MKKRKNPENPNTEQYVKDVRSVKSDEEDIILTPEELKEKMENELIQEKNKKSQRNAETESKYGDSSDPPKSANKK